MNIHSVTAPELPSPPIMRLLQRPATPAVIAAVSIGLDYLTGPFIQFPIAFVIPVALAAWFVHARLAYVLAVVQPLARLGFTCLWHTPWLPFDSEVNCFIRITILIFIAYLTIRTARQTHELEKEVRMLEGLLPVCSYCKKIRDEGNNWQQMESYIAKHSEAEFTHGICPECAKRFFGDFLPKNQSS